MCRVIDAFVERLDLRSLGFVRAEAAETGRTGCDPRDLLKLYLHGYLQQIRSSRRLEAECRCNVELMWLLGRIFGNPPFLLHGLSGAQVEVNLGTMAYNLKRMINVLGGSSRGPYCVSRSKRLERGG